MALGDVIARLAVHLGIDTAAFEQGATIAEKRVKKMQRSFESTAKKLVGVGQGMSAAITAPLVGFGAVAIKEANETNQAMAQVEAALKSMGPVAGKTADQLKSAADALELKSLAEADEILKKVTANLLTFGNISGQTFDRAQQAAVDLSARLGQDLQSSAIQVGKALNDPIKGMAALGRVGVQFSDSQKTAIKALVETGDVAKAQGIILAELERQFGGAAAAAQNADPFNKATDAFKQMAETVGQALLPIIPIFTDAVVAVADAFKSLSPETQKFIIIAGGIAAALGPALIGIGGLVSATGLLLPTLAKLAPALTGVGAGAGALIPLGPALAVIAGGAIAVYAAYQNWDKIKPWIDGVVERTTKASADINAELKAITDGANALDQRMGIPSKDQFLAKIVADFQGAIGKINSVLAAIQSAAASFDAAVVKAFRNAGAAVQNMVTQATAWLQKLSVPFNWVRQKAKEVGDAFLNLYDRVVGNSYIPDMVDEIGQHMARLDANLVKPATAATSKAGEAFLALQQRVQGLLAQLFPEQAREIQFNKDLADLKAYADQAKWSVEQLEQAINRLRSQTYNLPEVPLAVTQTDTTAPERMEIDWDAAANLGGALPQIIDQTQQWKDMLSDIGGALLERIGYSLSRIADGSMKLKDLWKDLLAFGLQVLTSQNGPLGNIFGGARAHGGPVRAGVPYLVGEKGPELFMPGRSGQVISNDNTRAMMGRGDVSVNVYGVTDVGGFNRSSTQIARATRRKLGV